MTDAGIEEIYLASSDAQARSSRSTSVYIFPCRMNGDKWLKMKAEANEKTRQFWGNLEKVYLAWQRQHRLLNYSVTAGGWYKLN